MVCCAVASVPVMPLHKEAIPLHITAKLPPPLVKRILEKNPKLGDAGNYLLAAVQQMPELLDRGAALECMLRTALLRRMCLARFRGKLLIMVVPFLAEMLQAMNVQLANAVVQSLPGVLTPKP